MEDKITFFDKTTKKQIEIDLSRVWHISGHIGVWGTKFLIDWGFKDEAPGTWGCSHVSLEDFIKLATKINTIEKIGK